MNTSINLLRNSFSALHGARFLAYPAGMAQSLCAARLETESLATVSGGAQ
jgi:hypothetical protein